MVEASLRGPPAAARRVVSRRRWWLGPVVLLVVLGVALVVGSGVFSQAPATAVQRAAALETNVRCPSCLDVSVADSQAATAVALRHQILSWVVEGRSDQAIDDLLVARYGQSILLSPPSSGLGSLVWVLPALAGAVAVGGLATLFWRRQRALRALHHEGSAKEDRAP